MADVVDTVIKSALEVIVNIAEQGGYLKKEVKEHILGAVSHIQDAWSKMERSMIEQNEQIIELNKALGRMKEEAEKQETSRREEGQVATSTGTYKDQPVGDSSGAMPSGEQQETDAGHGSSTDNKDKDGEIAAQRQPTETMEFKIQKIIESLEEKMVSRMKEEIQEAIKRGINQGPTGETSKKKERPAPVTAEENKSAEKGNRGEREEINQEEVGMSETAERRNGQTDIGEEQSDNEENEWRRVEYRKTTRNTRIIGTKETSNGRIRAGERTAWIYVGRLHYTTEKEDIITYLKEGGIKGKIEGEQLNTAGRNKSFKIGIPYEEKSKAEQPDFWPEGVIVRQYTFRRAQETGIRLQGREH